MIEGLVPVFPEHMAPLVERWLRSGVVLNRTCPMERRVDRLTGAALEARDYELMMAGWILSTCQARGATWMAVRAMLRDPGIQKELQRVAMEGWDTQAEPPSAEGECHGA